MVAVVGVFVVFLFVCFLFFLHAVSRIGADQVLGVDFAGYDADVGVPARTLVAVRTLAQAVGVDLLHLGAFLDAEQAARLFALAAQPLRRTTTTVMTVID